MSGMPDIERDPDSIEAAAIALAEDCTRLWLGGNHAPAWREVHEDVREEYRRQVRIVLDAYRCRVTDIGR